MNPKKVIILLVAVGLVAVLSSGCVGKQKQQSNPQVPQSSAGYFAGFSVREITDEEQGQEFSNLKIGWYSPMTKQRVVRYTDMQLGMKYRTVTVFYVSDAPAEISLFSSHEKYMVSTGKPINNYQRAPSSKGSHRVWEIDVRYDTPKEEDLPVSGSWNDGRTLKSTSIGIFSSSENTGFSINIQQPGNLGFSEGFS